MSTVRVFAGMARGRLEELLEAISNVRVALLGDLCLDVYWLADMRRSELSRETPHFPLPIVKERMSPGGGGNVAANLHALCPAALCVLGAVGDDWRGRELLRLLSGMEAQLEGLVQSGAVTTNAYIKPLRKGISDVVYEDPRLDFTAHMPLAAEVEERILQGLDTIVGQLDVLCVSDQMHFGVVTDRVRAKITELERQGLRVVVDSRDRIQRYSGGFLKPNEIEAARAVGADSEKLSGIGDFALIAQRLQAQNHSAVFMTMGARGSLVAGEETWHIPAHHISGPVDFVGAGDSSLAGFSLALAAGGSPCEAAYVAGLCSEVAIRQIGTTGTATREQILEWYDVCRQGAERQ